MKCPSPNFAPDHKVPGPPLNFLHSALNPQHSPMEHLLVFSSLVKMMKLSLTEVVRTEMGGEP